jgi:DnaJ-class molecular chaperone
MARGRGQFGANKYILRHQQTVIRDTEICRMCQGRGFVLEEEASAESSCGTCEQTGHNNSEGKDKRLSYDQPLSICGIARSRRKKRR